MRVVSLKLKRNTDGVSCFILPMIFFCFELHICCFTDMTRKSIKGIFLGKPLHRPLPPSKKNTHTFHLYTHTHFSLCHLHFSLFRMMSVLLMWFMQFTSLGLECSSSLTYINTYTHTYTHAHMHMHMHMHTCFQDKYVPWSLCATCTQSDYIAVYLAVIKLFCFVCVCFVCMCVDVSERESGEERGGGRQRDTEKMRDGAGDMMKCCLWKCAQTASVAAVSSPQCQVQELQLFLKVPL